MELTRRDAIAALVAGGVASGTLAVSELVVDEEPESDRQLSDRDVETATAVAGVIYPSEVTVSDEFVDTYVSSLTKRRRRDTVQAIHLLRDRTRREFGRPFAAIPAGDRNAVLRSMGVGRVQSRPDGTVPERVRYHLVNGLLYALFTTPKGSKLFGIQNPLGYPDGFATYRAQVESDGGADSNDG
jgi:hypothetical protein